MDFREFARWLVSTLIGLAVFLIVFVLLTDTGSSTPSPVENFDAFRLAIDEDRIEDAYALQDPASCRPDALEGATQAAAGLDDMGYSFSTAWVAADVWTNEDETEALIELQVKAPAPLPTVAHMVKVDGEWRLACE